MARIDSYRLRVVKDMLPHPDNYEISKWEMGTPNYEAIAGTVAAVDYIAGIAQPTPDDDRYQLQSCALACLGMCPRITLLQAEPCIDITHYYDWAGGLRW